MSNRQIVIACKIFQDEWNAVIPKSANFDVRWIDPGLHADLKRLEQVLTEEMRTAAETGAEVKVLYGNGCHPDIGLLAERCGAGTLPVKNCIEAFCGARTGELQKNRTMIMTPGWIRAWKSIMEAQGWDNTDARINLGIYDRILLLDAGVASLSDEEILEFFDIVQVPVDVQPLDLDCFRQCVSEVLEARGAGKGAAGLP